MAKKTRKKSAKKQAEDAGQAKASSQGKKKPSPTQTVSSRQTSAKRRILSAPALASSSQNKTKVNRSMSEPNMAAATIAKVIEPDSGIPVGLKLNRRFYEAAVMLDILGQNRGDHIEEEDAELGPSLSSLGSECLRRRSFLRHLAYLCDYEKGGDRTTAIALQHTPQQVIFWFATNSSSQRTTEFMRGVLQSLKCIGPNDVGRLESKVFEVAVEFSAKRISDYVKLMRGDVDFLMQELTASGSEEDTKLAFWLRTVQKAMSSRTEICKLSYTSRHSTEYEKLKIRARSGQRSSKRFEKIRHIIGRLNHTMKATKNVVAAGLYLPALFDDFEVRRLDSSAKSPSPLKQDLTLTEIAGRMLSDTTEIARCRRDLRDMDAKFNLSQRLKDRCAAADWRPRVHAELLVLDFFWANGLEFVDGDRYIACSKPACFLCHHYIAAHPGLFKAPPGHNNCYLRWRAPDITDGSRQDLIKTREKILNDITAKIRKEVLDQIRERRDPMAKKPDSLTEISSVRFEQQMSLDHETKEESGLFSSSEDSDDVDSEDSEACNAGDDSRSNAASIDEEFPERDCIDSEDDVVDEVDLDEESDEDEDEEGGISILVW